MRIPVFGIALVLLAASLLTLLVFGKSPAILGLSPDDFASAGYLTVWGLLVASALVFGRPRIHARLWHIAAWLAIFAALAAGYTYFHPEVMHFDPTAETRSA
ncbi:hypothetical protein [Oryzibacter oryziterrae]|uniref:hypothetical protein n=1 Tax=Oryzibacter oryziterrae TaxID=2766474 RepID=UPI001F35554A|nr:hypothetical protein [Oryzibacter oryziterrae]